MTQNCTNSSLSAFPANVKRIPFRSHSFPAGHTTRPVLLVQWPSRTRLPQTSPRNGRAAPVTEHHEGSDTDDGLRAEGELAPTDLRRNAPLLLIIVLVVVLAWFLLYLWRAMQQDGGTAAAPPGARVQARLPG